MKATSDGREAERLKKYPYMGSREVVGLQSSGAKKWLVRE